MSRTTRSTKQQHEGTQPILPKPTVEQMARAIEDAAEIADKFGDPDLNVPMVWDERIHQRRPLTANERAKVARYLRREAERRNRPWLVIARATGVA